MSRADVIDADLFLETSGDAIQRFVRKVVWRRTVAPPEVDHQAIANFNVPFPLRVAPLIEPLEQAMKGRFVQLPAEPEVPFAIVSVH